MLRGLAREAQPVEDGARTLSTRALPASSPSPCQGSWRAVGVIARCRLLALAGVPTLSEDPTQ